MREDADPTDAAELEKRQDQVVVAGVEVEAGVVDDPPCLLEVGRRLLDGRDAPIPASATMVSGSMLTTQRCGML